jgi:hypothetical protein
LIVPIVTVAHVALRDADLLPLVGAGTTLHARMIAATVTATVTATMIAIDERPVTDLAAPIDGQLLWPILFFFM